MPAVHAIVVSHRGASWISACLRALESQRARARVQIVVVDNGSVDGTAALLERDFPAITVLRLSRNEGYGRANNVALRRALAAGADFAVLVNDDVEVEAGWLQALLEAAAAHPEAGLFCGTLLFRGEERVNSTGVEIDAFGRARDRDFGVARGQVRREDGPVTAVTGGAALLRCELLRRIGVFDPGYFAYYEDVDLSLRAARSGSACWYVAKATARHRFAATAGSGSPLQRFLLGRGHLRTVALHGPPLRAAALLPLTAAYRVAVKVPLELFRGRPALAFAELRAAIAGSAAALAALPGRSRKVPRGAEP
ncbi:MAG TPA: glycosyltransferase family 2 protein [Myxococcales bacterium]|nr:glycosyltransferase family 2 protein [Myxococcales bacterium]